MGWNRLLRIGLLAVVLVTVSSCGDADVDIGPDPCFDGSIEFRMVNPLGIPGLALNVEWGSGCLIIRPVTKRVADTVEDFVVDASAGDVFMIGAFATDQGAVFESCTVGSTAEANGTLQLSVELDLDESLDIICDDAGNWQ